MTLLVSFFSWSDILFFPVCFAALFFILRNRANKVRDPRIRKIYYRAFYFKVICVIFFTLLSQFYFKGGDTNLYFQATKDLRAAISDNPDNFWVILKTTKLSDETVELNNYFYYDNFDQDITFNYMISTSNFFPGKLALFPSLLFGNSYLCINLVFGFFALGGAIRLFKAFLYFYPDLYRELAMACLFLPGVAFWSAGLLKDPITFGCIGIIMYGLVNLVFKKRDYIISSIWILVASYLMFSIKIYILLVLVLALLIWMFAEFNKLIKDRTLRQLFTVMTFTVGIIAGFFLLQYITSFEAAQQYQLDQLLASAEQERAGYDAVAATLPGDSHFTINTSSPVAMVFGGFTATFFRPFIWEINSPIAILSAAEATVFLLLTLILLLKLKPKKFFGTIWGDGKILMCFVFATVFSVAVGTSTANFGALSRYKIPCTAFYLIMLLLLYRKTKIEYPAWLNSMIQFTIPVKRRPHVRHSGSN